MKRMILGICLLGLFMRLTAQDKAFRNSVSLNFRNITSNIGADFPYRPAARLWIPGIEGRFDYGKQSSLRLGFDYQPLLSFGLGDVGSDRFFQTSSEGINVRAGLQYRFWGDEFSKNFRMYGFVDLILGREWVERRLNDQLARNPFEMHTESLSISTSLGLGVGAEYILLERLVLRAGGAIIGGVSLREEIDVLQTTTADFGFFPQDAETRFSLNMYLYSYDLSIGWRF